MRFFAAIAVLAIPAFAAPSGMLAVNKYKGDTKAGSYIVTLKDGVVSTESTNSLGSGSQVTHKFNVINGFAGTFTEDDLNKLRSDANVQSIEEDGIMKVFDTQNNAPWGIARLSSETKLQDQNPADLTFTYNYDGAGGNGVDVYVVDTGIYTAHPDFGGRAKWGKTFGGYPDADGHGHGTHCAGTVGSNSYGVSKKVNLIAVKVLSDQGSGSISDIVAGLDWVQSQAAATGHPTVATMSLGGGQADSLDQAVASLTGSGIHVTVAAGNDGSDAGSTSPARAPSAITVGASDISDTIASFSNYGSVVDVFGPGVSVISTWNDGKTNSISGTSMATPHIAGLVAYLISTGGNVSPADMSSKIASLADQGAISGIPSGTVNLLANNGFSG